MFDLESYLNTMRNTAETALNAVLPATGQRPEKLVEAMRYSVLSGGKRIRPVLCMASAEAAGGDAACAQAPAAAVELLHAYTLVHDDLPCMDDDDERRGKPTVHIVYGEANAVLVGDALQALAFDTLTKANLPAQIITALIAELSRAAGWNGVIGGQWEDVAESETTDIKTVEYVHQHKTADLFVAAIRMGAIAAQADDATLTQLTTFANALGVAFQVIDDLLDADESHPSQELSCLSVMSAAQARTKANDLTTRAMQALEQIGSSTIPLAAIAERMLHRTI